MFIAIDHQIHDAEAFQERGQQVFPLPEGFHVHHFLLSADASRAHCLYEAPSVERVRSYLDGKLGDASTQGYFAVAEEAGIGLPESRTASHSLSG